MSPSDLEIAGRLLAEHVSVPHSDAAHVQGRTRLVHSLGRPLSKPVFRRPPGRLVWIGLAAASLMAGVLYRHQTQSQDLPTSSLGERPLTCWVGPARQAGEVGAYVSPPAQARWDIQFSDGSKVALDPEAHGRVTRLTPRGADVLLENGRAHVFVVHRPQTEWNVAAGPYLIHVTGTEFDVGFEERTQTLMVDMHSGSVLVEGPGISAPLAIRGAQRFTHRAGTAAPTPSTSAPGTFGSPSGAPVLPRTAASSIPSCGPEERNHRPSPAPSPERSAAPTATASASWAQLAARGEYAAVVAQAEERGLERSLSTSNAAELLALGHAARFAGKSDLSARTYQALRARFSRSREANTAAFFLGRMTEDQSPNMAIGWYERYVAETPGGAWVPEAQGRRMVLLQKSGAHSAATAAARQYLASFPEGPYAGVAREMAQAP